MSSDQTDPAVPRPDAEIRTLLLTAKSLSPHNGFPSNSDG